MFNLFRRAAALAPVAAFAGLLQAGQWNVTFDDAEAGRPPPLAKAEAGAAASRLSEAVASSTGITVRVQAGLADPRTGRGLADGNVLVLDDQDGQGAAYVGVGIAPADAPATGRVMISWDMLIADTERQGNLFVNFSGAGGKELASLMVNVQQGTLNLLAPPVADGEPLNARLPGRLPIGQPAHMAAELDLDAARCRILLGDLEIGSGAIRRAALTGVRFMTTPPATGRVGLDNLRCGWSGKAAAAAPQVTAGRGFDLVRKGQACSAIIVPINASEVVELAATELRHYVERASGVRLEILREGSPVQEDAARIYVGPCRRSAAAGLDPAGFTLGTGHVRIDGRELFLIGKDGSGAVPAGGAPASAAAPLGTLYAVYDWLDRQLGVRWLWPGDTGTYVPKASTLVSGAAQDRLVVPSFRACRLRFGGWETTVQKKNKLMEDATFDAFMTGTRVWMRRQRFGAYSNLDYGHAYESYWKRFGKEHPEYFAQRPDGRRGPIDARENLTQMCVSEAGLHRQVIEDWLKQREAFPDKPWINGAENDRRVEDPACACAACRAWDVASAGKEEENPFLIASDAQEGKADVASQSYSDRYARFWMSLQKEGEKHDPEAAVIGYAYSHYSRPPVQTRLNERVVVEIVPPYYYPRNDAGKGFEALWGGWAWTGANLFLRPNYFHGGYCLPYIFAREFGNEFKYAVAHNLIATDFDSLTSMWGVQGPNLYMLGRLHARPELSVRQVLDEYYGAFGKGAKAVRDYFDFWEQVTAKEFAVPRRPYGGWLFKYADEVYTAERLARADRLLAKARAKTAAEPEAAERVAFLAKGLEHTRLLLQAIRDWKAFRAAPFERGAAERFRDSLKAVSAFREAIAGDFVVNPFYARNQERMDFNTRLLDILLAAPNRQELSGPWSFRWDPRAEGVSNRWFAVAGAQPAWLAVEVGKSWQEQSAALTPPAEDGVGWYRTEFARPSAAGRPVHLVFGAVDKSAAIWLNGAQIHERTYWPGLDPDMWQQPFAVKIPDGRWADGANRLTVRVEGRIGGGGVWKPVQLVW